MTNPVDDLGNVKVDFVWGNMPLQPDDQRGSNTLDPALDNHSIATTGWSNFPGYIPNYAGDGDPEEEALVPDVLRLSLNEASNLLTSLGILVGGAGINANILNISSSEDVISLTIRALTGVDGYESPVTLALKRGDVVNLVVDDVSWIAEGKITSVKANLSDSANTDLVVKLLNPATAPETPFDNFEPTQNNASKIYAGANTTDLVVWQGPYAVGDIVNADNSVYQFALVLPTL